MRPDPQGEVSANVVRALIAATIKRHPERTDLIVTAEDAVRELPEHAFVPAEVLLDFEEHLLVQGGADLIVEVARQAAWLATAQPISQMLDHKAAPLWKQNPIEVFRVLALARSRGVRNLGTIDVEETRDGCIVRFDALPASMQSRHGWRAAARGHFLGLLDMLQLEGEVRPLPLVQGDGAAAAVAFDVSWFKPRSGHRARRK
jgi:hypothetical protein